MLVLLYNVDNIYRLTVVYIGKLFSMSVYKRTHHMPQCHNTLTSSFAGLVHSSSKSHNTFVTSSASSDIKVPIRCLLPSSNVVVVILVGLGGCTRAAACSGLDEMRRRSPSS